MPKRVDDVRRFQVLSSRMFLNDEQVKNTPDSEFIVKYNDIVLEMSKMRKEDNKKIRRTFKIRDFTSKDELLKSMKDFDYDVRKQNEKFMNSKKGQQRIVDGKIEEISDMLEKAKPQPLIDEDVQKIISQENQVAQHFAAKIANRDEVRSRDISVTPTLTESARSPLLRDKITIADIFASPDFNKFAKTGSGSTFLLVGSSKSGKSVCALNLAMVWKKKFPKLIIVLVNDTWKASGGVFQPLIDEFPEDVKVVSSDKLDSTIKLVKQLQSESSGKYPFLFLIDDMVSSFYDSKLKWLINAGRNLNINTIMCLQTISMFHPSNRGSINYVIAGRLNNAEQRKKLYDMFLAGLLPWDKKDAMDNYQRETDNYQKIFIDCINDEVKKLIL